MKKIFSIGLTLLALAVVVSPAEAGYRHRGGNSIEIKKVCKTEVTQTNVSTIVNNVGVVTNTGGNKANGNTGGNVNVTSGNATSTVTINNVSGGNFAVVSGCGSCGSTCGDSETSCQE